MKICDVTQFYSPKSGGVKRYILEKRRYIDAHTQDEHYLIVPGQTTAVAHEGRLHTLTVQSPRVDRTSRYRILLNTKIVRDFLYDLRPDVIEAGDPYHLAWTAQRVGEEMDIPVVGFYHSHFPDAYLRTVLKYGGRWLRDVGMAYAQDYIVRLYSEFEHTLVPSPHLRNLLESWGVPNAVTVRLGVDTETFVPGEKDWEWRRKLEVPDDAFLLLYVGRLARDKNIDTLLDTFLELKQKSSRNYWLVVVGDGPLRRQLPAVRHMTNAVVWRSYVGSSATLARYYRAADLFVHPGVHETFGLVTLESQSCGCPVAGIRGSNMDANVMQCLDLWAHENTPEALKGTIEVMSALDLRTIGQHVAQEVAKRFSWTTVFQHLWQYYRKDFSCALPRVV